MVGGDDDEDGDDSDDDSTPFCATEMHEAINKKICVGAMSGIGKYPAVG